MIVISKNAPHIILLDLETLPNLPEALKVWTQLSAWPGRTLAANVSTIICAGWKVYGDEDAKCFSAWDYPEWLKDVNDDRKILTDLYPYLKEADAIVTHNGRRFDWKFLQTRLIYHGLPPLPQILHIDTCAESKKNFLTVNNRLDTLGRFLVGDKKLDNGGWDLWVKVHGRDEDAQKLMADYCKQDVLLLEKIFKRLLPLIQITPNHNLFTATKDHVCPGCGSGQIQSWGWRTMKTRRYRRYHCNSCGRTFQTDAKDEMPR